MKKAAKDRLAKGNAGKNFTELSEADLFDNMTFDYQGRVMEIKEVRVERIQPDNV
jgi:hypothetical protein